MERLTARKDDGVVYLKDNAMIWPVNMSGFDVRQVMEKLADYEDKEKSGTFIHKELQLDEYGFPHCPFCGSELETETMWDGQMFYGFRCKNLKCPASGCEVYYATPEEAKKAWSKRA